MENHIYNNTSVFQLNISQVNNPQFSDAKPSNNSDYYFQAIFEIQLALSQRTFKVAFNENELWAKCIVCDVTVCYFDYIGESFPWSLKLTYIVF